VKRRSAEGHVFGLLGSAGLHVVFECPLSKELRERCNSQRG
jgi:hypothetical protein